MALKFSMILEAIDRASAPSKRAQGSIERLTAGVRKWGREVRKNANDINTGTRSLEHYERRARRLQQVALGTFFRAAGQQARRFASDLRLGIRNLDLMGRAGRAAMSGLGSIGSGVLGAAQWGAAAIGAAGTYALYDMFKTAGQFEQYMVQMEVALGSTKKARQAMNWIKDFAQSTPFELEQVTKAFTVLQNSGLDPTNGLLRATGDAAAGMSSDIVEAALAVADASRGQFERLIDLGINASSKGDQVRLTWVKNGQEIEKVASKADKVGLAMAVAAAWSDKFGGSTEKQSKTLFGIINNLKDKWSGFLLMVADAGIFDKVKGRLSEWLTRLDKMAENGKLRKWAQDISNYLSDAFDWAVKFVNGVDWPSVGRGIGGAVMAMTKLVELFGQAVSKFYQFQAYRAANNYERIENGWFTSSKEKAAARANRRAIEAQYGVQTESGKEDEAARKDWGKKFFRRTLNGPDIPIGQGIRSLPKMGKPQASASHLEVGGSTKVEIALKGPIGGKVASLKANDPRVPMEVRLGKAMGAPA